MWRRTWLDSGGFHLRRDKIPDRPEDGRSILTGCQKTWQHWRPDIGVRGQGIAVMTDRERLTRSLPTGKQFAIRDIEYVDHRPSAERRIGNVLLHNPDLVLKPYFMKAIEYQHEKKVRVAAHCPQGMSGLMVADIRVNELIREVVVSPLLPEDEAEAIERIIRLRLEDGTVQVRQSKLIVRSPASSLIRNFEEQMYGTSDENIELSDLPLALRAL
jgi:hypothetical protein